MMSYMDLASYYKYNVHMRSMELFNWTSEDLDKMPPYEKDIYRAVCEQYMEALQNDREQASK